MKQYLELLGNVLGNGKLKQQRAVLKSTGQRPGCYSLFGAQMRFDLGEGFPLVTTRKISFKVVKTELLWFLRGHDNTNWLSENGVKIWDAWADDAGNLGLCYSSLWRSYPTSESNIDQVENLIYNIIQTKQHPESSCARRLLLLSWSPLLTNSKTPVGCHTLAQFDVTCGQLSCHLYMRSVDCFLGLPYNLACYALLTELLALVTGLTAGNLIWSGGDVHIYENHVDQAGRRTRRVS